MWKVHLFLTKIDVPFDGPASSSATISSACRCRFCSSRSFRKTPLGSVFPLDAFREAFPAVSHLIPFLWLHRLRSLTMDSFSVSLAASPAFSCLMPRWPWPRNVSCFFSVLMTATGTIKSLKTVSPVKADTTSTI